MSHTKCLLNVSKSSCENSKSGINVRLLIQMSVNRRRQLTFGQAHIQLDDESEEVVQLRRECQSFLSAIGQVIDFLAIFHLIIAGCATAYLSIILSTSDYVRWSSFFATLSQPADFFFYVVTFFLFLYVFGMTAIMFQIKTASQIARVAFMICAVVLGASLFLGTTSLPMAMMLDRSTSEYGNWISSALAQEVGKPKFYNVYRPIVTAKMLAIIFTAPVCSYLVSSVRYPTFYMMFSQM